ncbi:ARID DNA-binding domain-containing protein [Tanacetum coccineum]
MATTLRPFLIVWKYDVFVSFRGDDIRKNFMDHLFNDFKQKGILAFRDDRELPKGEEISPHLYKAIEESRTYAKAFAKHGLSNRTEVDKWREALSMAANLSGWDLQDMTNGYGSDHGRRPRPIDEEEVTSRFLQRETPQKGSPWNSTKKSLSPGCKEMLLKRMKEVEAFNASSETTRHGEIAEPKRRMGLRCTNALIRVMDYVDDEYISWNGSLYALKVNSLSRFLSFMDLLKKDSLVYKNWEIFSRKFVEMVKWFYLVYLNYERLDEIPPRVGVVEINLLSLHKIIDNLGGYLCVTLGDKWKIVAGLQGLTEDDGEAMRDCYKKFIDMVQVYYETAERPWYDRKPGKEVGKSSSIPTKVEDPQGKDKDKAGIEEAQEALEEGMNLETQFGVRLEGNREEDAEQGSIIDSNDFKVIV